MQCYSVQCSVPLVVWLPCLSSREELQQGEGKSYVDTTAWGSENRGGGGLRTEDRGAVLALCSTIRIGRESWCLPYAGFFLSTLSGLHFHFWILDAM